MPACRGSPGGCHCRRRHSWRRCSRVAQREIALVEAGGLRVGVEVGATAEDDMMNPRSPGEARPPRPRPVELLPAFVSESLVDIDALGSAVVVTVDRRPPLLVSADAGLTWSERGGGLPRGGGRSRRGARRCPLRGAQTPVRIERRRRLLARHRVELQDRGLSPGHDPAGRTVHEAGTVRDRLVRQIALR